MSEADQTPGSVVVTGAGSGVGRAVALALAAEGWRVGVVGRRPAALAETVAADPGGRCVALRCDVGDPDAVAAMAAQAVSAMGPVGALVNAAGLNAPRRSLEELSLQDYRAIIDANLNGAYLCVQAFLPGMRARGSGTIVNVISDAGKQASPKAGPAYVMSKFGLAGLTQAINAEERSRGVRACGVFPGDIDTPLLDRRPAPPDAAARARMLRADDVAACVLFCLKLPPWAVVEELLIRPR